MNDKKKRQTVAEAETKGRYEGAKEELQNLKDQIRLREEALKRKGLENEKM